MLYNGLGRYAEALAAAEQAFEYVDLAIFRPLPELIEAAARTGRDDLAAAALEQLAERTGAAGTERDSTPST